VQAPVAPACVIVASWQPIMTVPDREVVVGFGGTLNVMVALPDPVAVLLTVIQLVELNALHGHPVPVVTVTETVPLPPPTDCEAGDNE